MDKELYKLTLEELKALYAKGELTRNDLFIQNDNVTTVLHWLEYENRNKY